MKSVLSKLDQLAGIEPGSPLAAWLERGAFVFLLLMAASVPQSIAATQIAWLLGMTLSAARLFITPRPRFRFFAFDAFLLAFIGWSVLSAALSYEPAISLDKLRGVGLFLIFFLARLNLRTRSAIAAVAFLMIGSAMVNVVWQPVERIIGRGVEVHGLRADGALAKSGLANGDAILRINGKRISSPDEIISALEVNETAEATFNRPDIYRTLTLRRSDLASGTSAEERLGFASWKKSHRWRAQGFFGHFTTYGEVLQIIASLALGLVLGLTFGRGSALREFLKSQRLRIALVAAVCLALICVALLLSGTRASQLGLLVSGIVMVLAIGNRRLIALMLVVLIPAAAGGYYVVQQTRQQDETNEYRKTMWRDGIRLATESPRHLLVGVGMDSLKNRWQEWGLFDRGWLPMGHFHSTPIQIAAERGLPALLFWLLFLGAYVRSLWRYLRLGGDVPDVPYAIALGVLGGVAGFFTAGIVHNNLGDGEVAMAFYLAAALGAAELVKKNVSPE